MSQPLQHQPLNGIVEYEAALDALLSKAQHTIRVFDRVLGKDFDHAKRHDVLREFLRADRSNRLSIVLHQTGNLARDCPRLLALLKPYSHSLSIHETQPHAQNAQDPFVIVDDRHFLHRFHYDGLRSLLAWNDPNGARQLLERFDNLWEASFPAVSATTIGL